MANPLAVFSGLGSLLIVAFGVAAAANGTVSPISAASIVEPYVPGLGDFMTGYVQPHHIKLWFAASAGSWELAAYEANELSETFEDISTYQAVWKAVPVAQYIKITIVPAQKQVDSAIRARDLQAFKAAYRTLTAACNACHAKAQHEFLVIKIPTVNSFPDQSFASH